MLLHTADISLNGRKPTPREKKTDQNFTNQVCRSGDDLAGKHRKKEHRLIHTVFQHLQSIAFVLNFGGARTAIEGLSSRISARWRLAVVRCCRVAVFEYAVCRCLVPESMKTGEYQGGS